MTERDKKRTDKKRHDFDFLDIRNRGFKDVQDPLSQLDSDDVIVGVNVIVAV